MPTGGASTSTEEMDLLTKLDRGSLTFRISSISVPKDKASPPMETYYNSDSTVIAVTGYNENKRHFCYLLGGIPSSDVPLPGKHVVYEFHFNSLEENKFVDMEELPKSGFPSRVDGFALLGTVQEESRMKPTKVNLLTSSFPEQDPEGTRVFGTSRGGMMVTASGDVELVNSEGKSIKITEEGLDIGDMKITGEAQGHDNMFIMRNPFNSGEIMGVPIPDVLPLSIVTHNPTLNLPAIANAYVKLDNYKKLGEGIKNIIKKMENIKNLS